MPSEVSNREVARKSIVARHPILAGEKLTEDNLTIKRPGTGISPMDWIKLLGRNASKNYSADELIDET